MVDVVGHCGVARRHRRLAAGHELHQRQALPFAERGIDHIAGGLHQPLVVRVGQKAVDQHDPALVGLVLVEVVQHVGQRVADIVVGQFQHQGGVGTVAKGGAERTDHVLPVLAPVVGVEHRGVDHPVEQQLAIAGRGIEQYWRAFAQRARAIGIQVQGAAVEQQSVQVEGHTGRPWLLAQLLATAGEAIPDRGRDRADRVVLAHHLAHRSHGKAGVGDRRARGAQDQPPVMARLALPAFGGNGAELPGEHRDGRAGVMVGRAMGRRERQEDARLAAALAVEIQAVHQLVGVADLQHLAQAFQHRPELLEHEVVAVLGTAQVLLDVALVGFRMDEDQHQALPATAREDAPSASVSGVRAKNSRRRPWTLAKLLYSCMRRAAARDIDWYPAGFSLAMR